MFLSRLCRDGVMCRLELILRHAKELRSSFLKKSLKQVFAIAIGITQTSLWVDDSYDESASAGLAVVTQGQSKQSK